MENRVLEFFFQNWHRPMYLFPTCTHFKFEFFDRSKPFSYPVAIEVGNWQPTIFEKYEFQPVFLIFSIYKLKDHIIWSFWSVKLINTENQKNWLKFIFFKNCHLSVAYFACIDTPSYCCIIIDLPGKFGFVEFCSCNYSGRKWHINL